MYSVAQPFAGAVTCQRRSGEMTVNDARSMMLWALLVLGCGRALAADAFECARVEPSKERTPSYGLVTGERRCEGFFRQSIAGPYLEVVSLIVAGSSAGPAGAPLKLRAPSSASRLVVTPLPQGVAYRVDLPNAGPETQWQAQPMLDATALRKAELGFLGIVTDPSKAGMNLAPVTIGEGAGSGKTVAIVRTSVQTQEMRWRRLDGGDTSAPWSTIEGGALDPWGRTYIRLDTPSAEKPALVQVEARRPGGEALPILEFRIWSR
jgi:hypothetical protein